MSSSAAHIEPPPPPLAPCINTTAPATEIAHFDNQHQHQHHHHNNNNRNQHHHHHHTPTDDDLHVTGNPHMLKIASHTAYRGAARSPASILSKKASWVDTSRSVSLSPRSLSRPASAAASPVGTPIGTPRVRSPAGTPRTRSPARGFATGAARLGRQEGVGDEPPKHAMRVFEGLLGERRRFGEFRRVLHTGLYSQLVAMEIPVSGDIGDEVHTVDQTLLFTHGTGLAQVAGEERAVGAGDVVVVPAGTRHQFLNTGDEPLELITVYAPAEHDARTVHATKEEGDAEEEAGIDVAPAWARRGQRDNGERGLVKGEGGPYDE